MILFMILLVPLIGLVVVSLHLAFSGNLAGRAYIGWIVLLVSIVLTKLAELYSRLDDIEKARACVEAIIRNYPNSRYAGYARDWINNM